MKSFSNSLQGYSVTLQAKVWIKKNFSEVGKGKIRNLNPFLKEGHRLVSNTDSTANSIFITYNYIHYLLFVIFHEV